MEDNLKQIKSSIRKEVLRKRDSLSLESREIASIHMTTSLIQEVLFLDSENILCFASYGSEINTFPFMQAVLEAGKKLFVPRIIVDEMNFYQIHSLADLQPGYKGILEPLNVAEMYKYNDELAKNSFLIMPGVAFDVNNHRMGYGKGFYDRYLSDKQILLERSIAIGFQCQLVERIPFDQFDKRPAEVRVF